MAQIYDYLVIGAGPAGMAAAIEASNTGLSVLVLDQASSAGGQIYRNLGHADKQQTSVLGSNYGAGKPLLERFMAANCDYQSFSSSLAYRDSCKGIFGGSHRRRRNKKLSYKSFVISSWGHGKAHGRNRLAQAWGPDCWGRTDSPKVFSLNA